MRIEEYDVISRTTLADLTRGVDEAIKEGWIPQGGICMEDDAHVSFRRYLQAVIREADDGNDTI